MRKLYYNVRTDQGFFCGHNHTSEHQARKCMDQYLAQHPKKYYDHAGMFISYYDVPIALLRTHLETEKALH